MHIRVLAHEIDGCQEGRQVFHDAAKYIRTQLEILKDRVESDLRIEIEERMPIEFVVQLIHHDEYPGELLLPDSFEEEAYNGNRFLYLAGLARNRKKTIPAEFVAGFGNEGEIMFRCEGDVFNVNVSRLNSDGDGVLDEYVLNQGNWTALCEEKELEFGDIVVFTKIRNNLINVMGFIVDGSSNTNAQFLGVTRLNAVQPAVPHEDAKDERMYHLCMWPGHREHFHEKTDVFYKRFSEILAFNHLAIPAKFQGENPMHMYRKALLKYNQLELEFSVRIDHHHENPSRTNHVNMYGEWAWFGQQCGFGYTKMLRFRLMWVVSDLEDDEEICYPVFHVHLLMILPKTICVMLVVRMYGT
ncbi:Peptidase M28 [Artemisia annua]|uniref:Peptidase M28 n=1 Tax=Artemisia annua TaxID=35608 RepID=A0A2U1KD97_ARTAN|nr:Peptidase M28 [Artemisia annua]